MAFSPGAQAELYEPPGAVAADMRPGAGALQSQSAFEALRESARTPHTRIELRIEGSKTEVEAERP